MCIAQQTPNTHDEINILCLKYLQCKNVYILGYTPSFMYNLSHHDTSFTSQHPSNAQLMYFFTAAVHENPSVSPFMVEQRLKSR